MSDPAAHLQLALADGTALRACWQDELRKGRLLVPDDPAVELLAPVTVDLVVDDETIAAVPAQAVHRLPGGGGLGLTVGAVAPEVEGQIERAIVRLAAQGGGGGGQQAAARANPAAAGAPIALRYKEMSTSEKTTVALRGGRDGRTQILKEGNPTLLKYMLQNPRLTSREVATMASNFSAGVDILKMISDNPQHSSNDAVRLALVTNPRCPPQIMRKHIQKLPRAQVAKLAKSDHVREEVRRVARKMVVNRRG